MTKVVLFTHFHPFSEKEIFLREEVVYLSRHLDELIVIPLLEDSSHRNMNSDLQNIFVSEPIVNKKRILIQALNHL